MNLLSLYLAPGHQRPGDLEYTRRLQPSVGRILEPDVNDIANVHAASPGTLIMPRYWWLDDGNRQQYIAMMTDPVGTGKRHAAEWARELSRLHREAGERGLTIPQRMVVTGVNEPDTNEAEGQTVEYNRVFLSELAEQGLQGGALCLSVGHPTRLKPGKIIDWDAYMPLERIIQQGKHYVVLHEYWQEEGPFHGDDWGFLAGRHKQCPFDAPIIIGEAGVDGGIYNRYPRNVGWHALLKGDAGKFAAQVSAYCNAADPRVIGVCLFITDYRDNHWASFDTEAAHGRLLEAAEQIRQVGPPQWGGGVSTDGNAGLIKYVTAVAGLNVRAAPNMDAKVTDTLPHGTPVRVETAFGVWRKVGLDAWVHSEYLSDSQPSAPPPVVVEPGPVEPIPIEPITVEPGAVGDDWSRIYAFIIRWEGGWADHPNDPGGATMSGITIGTYTRWREAQGQPKPTKDDLRNIPDAEKQAIYREWYWKASGADRLPWPMNLAVMDTAVNGGVGRATDIFQRSNGDFLRYMGILIDWYTRINNFETFGRAWIRRRAEILLEASTK